MHFKFVSSRDHATFKFDGGFITVADLKRAISAQKKLDRSADTDLLITNAMTREGPFGAASLRLRLRLRPAHKPDALHCAALTRTHTRARCLFFARIVAEYVDENSHVPKNTSVIIKRLPKAMVLRMRYEQKKLAAAAAAFPCATETPTVVRLHLVPPARARYGCLNPPRACRALLGSTNR